MQRRQRDVTLELGDDVGGHPHWAAELRSSMDDPVADGHQIDLLRAPQPIARFLGRGG
jgi:hypothetical protein